MRLQNLKREIILTKHAAVRTQQRGISGDAISTILNYGHFNYTRGGAKTWSMNRLEKQFAKADLGQKYINIEKQLGYLVISNEGVLITAAHSFKRLRN